MPRCALPDKIIKDPKGRDVNLKDARHWDWPWPLSYTKRSVNAFGPRCAKDSEGYMAWPPKLVKGRSVTRWETDGAQSIIYIPELDNAEYEGKDVYGRKYIAYERTGPKRYDKKIVVKLDWEEGMFIQGQYSPSALQRTSDNGWMKLDPYYYSWWKLITRYSSDFEEDLFWFYRWGYRPDHLDVYWNWGPMAGRKMD